MPKQRKVTAAWGGSLGERVHLVASAEVFDRNGLSSASRWFATPAAIVPNPGFTPSNDQRLLHVVRNAYDADQSLGGLILSGPLAGQQFLPDGTTVSYVPSSCSVSQPYVLCDSPRQDLAATLGTVALTSPQRRVAGFSRLTLQVTPDVEAWFDALASRNRTAITSVPLETSEFGLRLPIDVAENPFLPDAVRAQYIAAGEPTFLIGRQNTDEGTFEDVLRQSVESFSAGVRTRLGETWRLQARASYAQSDTGESWRNIYSIDRFVNAVDAVLVNGTPTCRINAVTMTDPACAPADIFGSGNMSAAAKEYFLGTIHKPLKTYAAGACAACHRPAAFAVGGSGFRRRGRRLSQGARAAVQRRREPRLCVRRISGILGRDGSQPKLMRKPSFPCSTTGRSRARWKPISPRVG